MKALLFTASLIFLSAVAAAKEKDQTQLTTKEVAILEKIQYAVVSDTTGLRKERKIVVPTKTSDEFMAFMRSAFGSRISSRVKLPEGVLGITETVYPEPFKFKTAAGKKGVKVRIRHYIDESAATGNRARSAFTKNQKFVELKFEHFEHDDVAVKDRIRLPDELVDSVANLKTLTKNRKLIEKAAAEDKENEDASVGLILDFLTEIQNGRAIDRLKPILTTVYTRESFKIPLVDKAGKSILDKKGQATQIEITLDRNTKIFEPGSTKPTVEYPADVTIVELKIPLIYGELTPKDIEEVPDLEVVSKALALLKKNRVSEFEENKGKFSSFGRAKKEKKK